MQISCKVFPEETDPSDPQLTSYLGSALGEAESAHHTDADNCKKQDYRQDDPTYPGGGFRFCCRSSILGAKIR